MKLLSSILFLGCFILSLSGVAQLKTTKNASIQFHSSIGGINAKNSKVYSELNTNTGQLTFKANIENFIFKNSLMQKHYNEEDMMNSSKFPNSKFIGTISNNAKINYKTNGTYPVSVKGKLTIKGVTKEITTKGKIEIKNGVITASSIFSIDRHNYNVVGNEESVSQVLKLTVIANYPL